MGNNVNHLFRAYRDINNLSDIFPQVNTHGILARI